MKKFIFYTLGLAFISIIIFLCYIKLVFPKVAEEEDLKIEITKERVERGAYLANHVMLCTDCHSIRDWSKYGAPFDKQKMGGGGENFNQDMGFPGNFPSKNITPFALKDWSDGEIFRALVAGVSKDGSPLFPVMPYQNYAQLDREDLYAIIAYLRTIPEVKRTNDPSKADFPMNFIMRTIPKDEHVTQKRPSKTNRVAYGKYLFTAASCNDCHTQKNHGEQVAGLEMAGGFEFKLPGNRIVRSANITPHKETGIGNWTEEAFIAKFRMYNDSVFTPSTLKKDQFNTVMPWIMYSGMNDEDLGAIFAYLKTVKPIKNEVERFSKSAAK